MAVQDKIEISDLASEFKSIEKDNTTNIFFSYLIILNYLFLFMRPQNDLPFLAAAKVPMVVNIFPMVLWLISFNRNWTKTNLVMLLFLAGEAVRTFIGKSVIDGFVVNDFWQFHTLEGIVLQTIGLAFPITIFFLSLSALKSLLRASLFIGFYLSLYGLTHAGMGPGGFLGDENDLGLALLFFLAYSLMYITDGMLSPIQKSIFYFLAFFNIIAVVITASRGAFVGLVCVLGYCFIRSNRKIYFIAIAFLLFITALPFVPASYYTEVSSIADTNTGTAEIRKHYWKLATRIFLDPKNTLTGVGLNNTSFNIDRYETAEDLVKFPSAAGRVVHSLYFEVLADLGIWGIFIIAYVIINSYRSNALCYDVIKNTKEDLELAYKKATNNENKTLEIYLTDSVRSCYKQINFILPFCLSANVSIIAIFSAGAFISVAYYPFIWLAVGVSSAIRLYSKKLLNLTDQLLLHL